MDLRKSVAVAQAVFLMMMFIGCGDDTVAPPVKSPLEKLAGDWEVVTMTADTVVHVLPDNNTHWYFSESGEYCTLWRTAYGTYIPGNSGQVSSDGQILTEEFEDFEATWLLALSSGADSLHASLIEPDTLDIDSWFLVRVEDAPEATCFPDGQ